MATPNAAIVAWKTPYISGLGLTYGTATTLSVAAGACTDSSVSNEIVLESAVTFDGETTGANGLDAGALAASTFYYVYAIGSSRSPINGDNYLMTSTVAYPGACLASTSDTPSLPANYDMYRRIGYFLTDSSSEILNFVQTGNGVERTMRYDVGISVLSGGTSATYANVNLVTAVPAINLEVLLLASVTPTAADDELNLVPYSSSATVGYAVVTGDVAAVVVKLVVSCPCSSNAGVPYIKYKVTGAASLSVVGYIDQL